MKIDLSKIIELQKNIDNFIHKKFNLTYKKTQIQRRLALLVEIGEFANEVRCFKYWSEKTQSDDDIILNEFADILHFAFSLLLGFSEFKDHKKIILNIKVGSDKCNKIDLCKKIINLYNLALAYKTFDELLNFIKISIKTIFYMGYSWKQVFNMYLSKNAVNHERQKNAY